MWGGGALQVQVDRGRNAEGKGGERNSRLDLQAPDTQPQTFPDLPARDKERLPHRTPNMSPLQELV